MRVFSRRGSLPYLLLAILLITPIGVQAQGLERLKFNNPGLVVDLAVGLWAFPMPMDVNGDGQWDLAVSCPDKPYNGVYLFENPGVDTAKDAFPVFKTPRRIGPGRQFAGVSFVQGVPHVLTPATEYPDFLQTGLAKGVKLGLPANVHPRTVRGNFWRYVDFDGDGKTDLIVGVDDWTEYGWDNAYNAAGEWTNGPLRGFVYLLRNTGTNEQPHYEKPVQLQAGDKPLETFGWPSPCFADFAGHGKA